MTGSGSMCAAPPDVGGGGSGNETPLASAAAVASAATAAVASVRTGDAPVPAAACVRGVDRPHGVHARTRAAASRRRCRAAVDGRGGPVASARRGAHAGDAGAVGRESAARAPPPARRSCYLPRDRGVGRRPRCPLRPWGVSPARTVGGCPHHAAGVSGAQAATCQAGGARRQLGRTGGRPTGRRAPGIGSRLGGAGARGRAAAMTGSVVDAALCGGSRILWGARRTGRVSRADDPLRGRLCFVAAPPGAGATAKEVLACAVVEVTRGMRRGYHGDSDWARGGHARCPDVYFTEAGALRLVWGPQRLFERHAARAASTGTEGA